MQRPAFSFYGTLAASKSLMNRALIVQSFRPSLRLLGSASSEDVRALQTSLQTLKQSENSQGRIDLEAGAGGTTLRFLALRVSRRPGHYRIHGTSRLLSRPQAGLQELLGQLGVASEVLVQAGSAALEIRSPGWTLPAREILVDRASSSQFASAIALSAWDLPQDLNLRWSGAAAEEGFVSDAYFQMSLSLLAELGLKLESSREGLRIPAGQKVDERAEYRIEPDLSSCFAVAALAALQGRAEFVDFPERPLQPDRRFVEILRQMGAPVQYVSSAKGPNLVVEKAPTLRALEVDLRDTPDLFPVLAVLAACAHGRSLLSGARHLVHKESNRILKSAELLRGLGGQIEILEDGLAITGGLHPSGTLTYDTDEDHRLAMAAGILKRVGFPLRVQHPEVVQKSFANFWDVIGESPC